MKQKRYLLGLFSGICAAALAFSVNTGFVEAAQREKTFVCMTDQIGEESTDPLTVQIPVTTETPLVVDIPIATETPQPEQTPLEIQIPVVTETPQPAETPAVTETPQPTETPVVTEAPQPTGTPVVTETPQPTETPAVTETPQPTETPIATETPQPTKSPEPQKTAPPVFNMKALNQYVSLNKNNKLVFDKRGIRDYLLEYNETADPSVNAYIEAGEDRYQLVKQVYGKQIAIKKLLADLNPSVEKINVRTYYKRPTRLRRDLVKAVKEMNARVRWSVTYDNGATIQSGMKYVILKNKWTGRYSLDSSFIKDSYGKIVDRYRGGSNWTFITHDGKEVRISTRRLSADYLKEYAQLVKLFKSAKSQSKRVPVCGGLGSKYIEISLKDQGLWFMENGKVVKETPVVTGTDTNPGRRTPDGVYAIIERVPGKYLIGPGYKTWVNQWMRLTWDGIGIHDAYWRPDADFKSKNTYIYNGSHGCINLPKDFAAWLYPRTENGMLVVIY